MTDGQGRRVAPHGIRGGGEAFAGPFGAQSAEVVADEQRSAAFAEVPGATGFEFSAAQTALKVRHKGLGLGWVWSEHGEDS